MDTVRKLTQMELFMMVIFPMGPKMDKARSSGLTVQPTLAISKTITSMAMAFTRGKRAKCIKVNGKPIKCMEKENSHGQMVEFIKAVTSKTKNMGKES